MPDIIRILLIAKSKWKWMAFGVSASVFVITANSLLMAISGWFIASMAVAGVTKVTFNYFIPSAAIRLLAISRTVGRYIERLVTHDAAFRVISELRVWLFIKFAPLSPAILEKYASGELASRFRSDIDSLENLYLRIIAPIAAGIVAIIVSTAFVGIWNISAASALLVFLLISGTLIPLIARRLALPHGIRTARLTGDLRRVITDGVAAGDELILLGAVGKSAQIVKEISSVLASEQENLSVKGGLVSSFQLVSMAAGTAALLLISAVSVISGDLDGPQLVMLLLFSTASFEAAAGISSAMMLFPTVSESASRIIALSETNHPVIETDADSSFINGYAVKMENVSFSYDGYRYPLKNFNLHIPEGSRIALKGESGAGKSSVVDLLLRFREYTGSITFGGCELKGLNGEVVRARLSVLLQKPHIFNATIRENILLASPDASQDELAAVIHTAVLEDWIATLPDGLETRAGEGGREISGGEAKRVALARTLLKSADLYILDEPTEGLDPVMEHKLIARLDNHIKGKSLLIITHREAPLKIADSIVRM